jgi:hypothetical protein
VSEFWSRGMDEKLPHTDEVKASSAQKVSVAPLTVQDSGQGPSLEAWGPERDCIGVNRS